MEYQAFANEFVKLATSTRALYEQEKADREFKALLNSSKPGVPPKAFAKGFAAGSAIPLLITANLHLSNRGNLERAKGAVRQVHVAEALKKFNIVNPHGMQVFNEEVVDKL